MEELLFVKGYKDNESLRNSFNQLATDTFGIQFEDWYQHGYWTEKYQPYSFIDNGKVVANVSVNLLNLVINAEELKSVQIGTVMTHPDYRNRGLSRRLMELVLEDYKSVDLIYLFANQTVLDFYPKFGFHAMDEVQFSWNYTYNGSNPLGVKRLNGRNAKDLDFIYSMVSKREPVSKTFGTSDSQELFMFYCLMVFSQDIYYLEEEEALVIYQIEDNQLHLYDMVSSQNVSVQNIVNKIALENINQVIFHYHPYNQEINIQKEQYSTNDVLFVKNMTDVLLPQQFKHPITSKA